VDTLGLVLKVKVHAANIQDRHGAHWLLAPLGAVFPRIHLVWVDRGYNGDLDEWMQSYLGWRLCIVQRSASVPQAKRRFQKQARERQRQGCAGAAIYAGLKLTPDFQVIPQRWVVERTFAWLGRQRRLSKDYEYLPASSESMVYLAMIRLMLKRLAKGAPL
jgi:putative transposase